MKAYIIGGRRTKTARERNSEISRILESQSVKVDKSQINGSHDYDTTHYDQSLMRDTLGIKKADFVVIEVTEVSNGIGFLAASALYAKKPVIALFDSTQITNPSLTLKAATKNKLFSLIGYTPSDLEIQLNSCIPRINELLNIKFLLIISPEIDSYLEWASHEYKLHKSQIMRMSVEERMAQDVRWKNQSI